MFSGVESFFEYECWSVGEYIVYTSE